MIDEITYFGSVDPKLVAQDFTWEDRKSFTVTKEILWFSNTATDKEIKAKETEIIKLHKSNDPRIGYNQRPRSSNDKIR